MKKQRKENGKRGKGLGLRSKGIGIYKIRNIPVNKKWQLVKDYLSYHFSSARFYETGIDEFGFLENIFIVLTRD